MKKPRTAIPDDVSAEVMFQHDRTCCVCGDRQLAVQIHHINEDPTDHSINNLTVLCLEHHEQTQIRGGFAKKLKAADIIRHREDWLRRVKARREKADELVVRHMVGIPQPTLGSVEDWNEPSEVKVTGYLNALPGIRRAAIQAAQPLWDSGIASQMTQGSYNAIDILEAAWQRLAKYYPPNHFGDKAANLFFSEFIVNRFAWYRSIYEPLGPGSSGTIVSVIVGSAVLGDVANAIAETVEGLLVGYNLTGSFDSEKWRSDWGAAGQPDAE